MAKCVNDPVNITFLIDKLDEYGFNANGDQADAPKAVQRTTQ